MGGFGVQELAIVAVIIMILFGGAALPKIARKSGRQLRETKDAAGSFKEEFEKGLNDANPVAEIKDTLKSADPREALRSATDSVRNAEIPPAAAEVAQTAEKLAE